MSSLPAALIAAAIIAAMIACGGETVLNIVEHVCEDASCICFWCYVNNQDRGACLPEQDLQQTFFLQVST